MKKYLYSCIEFNGLHCTLKYPKHPSVEKSSFFFDANWMTKGDYAQVEVIAIYMDKKVLCFHVKYVYDSNNKSKYPLYKYYQLHPDHDDGTQTPIPLHITLWTAEGTKPVESGIRLKKFLDGKSSVDCNYVTLDKPIVIKGNTKLVEADEPLEIES